MNREMQTERLKKALAVYGADPDHWPVDEKDALKALLHSNREAFETDLRVAVELDTFMDAAPLPPIPDGAMARALAIATENPKAEVIEFQPRVSHSFGHNAGFNIRQVLPTGIALAASLALGVFVGLNDQIGSYVPSVVSVANTELQGEAAADDLLKFDPFDLSNGEVL